MTVPIHITAEAEAHLLALCQSEQAQGFHLSVKKAGCSGYRYVPDVYQTLAPEDQAFKIGALSVAVPEASLSLLQGLTVDLKTGSLGQTQLVFDHPRASNVCGCGESFNLNGESDGDDSD